MTRTDTGYVSFLLRLRRIESQDHRTWVASMQSTATGESQTFSTVAALVEFLEAEFGTCLQSGVPGQNRNGEFHKH